MDAANATRACVVCGGGFAWAPRVKFCSDECRNARRQQQTLSGNAKKKPPRRKCGHCDKEFQPAQGVGSRYCSREHAAEAKRLRDNARNSDPEKALDMRAARSRWARSPEGRAWRAERLKSGVDAATVKALRKRAGRDRRNEYANRRARLGIDERKHQRAVLRENRAEAKATANVRASQAKAARQAEREADRIASAESRATRSRGLAESTIRLKARPERYAEELGRWRARGFKRKTGKDMASDGTVDASVVFAGKSCLYCNCALHHLNRTIDHMDPLNRGGVHSAANIAPCCHRCNSSKGAKAFNAYVSKLSDEHRTRAVKFYEKRLGPMQQGSLTLGMAA